MSPRRFQYRRGIALPPGTKLVARPTVYGNPFKIVRVPTGDARPYSPWEILWTPERSQRDVHDEAVRWYRWWVTDGVSFRRHQELGGGGTLSGRSSLPTTFPEWVERASDELRDVLIPELVGRDLACYCPLTDEDGHPLPCHADVLLELAAQHERMVRW